MVAEDFGHEEAGEFISDIEECYKEFKYDDDGHGVMMLHFELAKAYLTGQAELPINMKLAEKHLEEFLEGPHVNLQNARKQFLDDLIVDLEEDAKNTVERCLRNQPFRSVKRRIDRMQHLFQFKYGGAGIPIKILESESDLLRAETEEAINFLLSLRISTGHPGN